MSETADLLQQLIDIRHKVASENLTGGRKKSSRSYSKKKVPVTMNGRTFKARERIKGPVPSQLKQWNSAVQKARKELKVKGFQKIKKGTKLYTLAKNIYEKKKKRGSSGKKKKPRKKRASGSKKKRKSSTKKRK